MRSRWSAQFFSSLGEWRMKRIYAGETLFAKSCFLTWKSWRVCQSCSKS
jgi:hypothetical protein